MRLRLRSRHCRVRPDPYKGSGVSLKGERPTTQPARQPRRAVATSTYLRLVRRQLARLRPHGLKRLHQPCHSQLVGDALPAAHWACARRSQRELAATSLGSHPPLPHSLRREGLVPAPGVESSPLDSCTPLRHLDRRQAPLAQAARRRSSCPRRAAEAEARRGSHSSNARQHCRSCDPNTKHQRTPTLAGRCTGALGDSRRGSAVAKSCSRLLWGWCSSHGRFGLWAPRGHRVNYTGRRPIAAG